MVAAEYGDAPIVEALLKAGAEADLQDEVSVAVPTVGVAVPTVSVAVPSPARSGQGTASFFCCCGGREGVDLFIFVRI